MPFKKKLLDILADKGCEKFAVRQSLPYRAHFLYI